MRRLPERRIVGRASEELAPSSVIGLGGLYWSVCRFDMKVVVTHQIVSSMVMRWGRVRRDHEMKSKTTDGIVCIRLIISALIIWIILMSDMLWTIAHIY